MLGAIEERVRRRGPDATAWSPARSARCCAPSIRTRTSSSRRTTRRCRSARRARTTGSASPCSRSTATSRWSRPFEGTPAHRLGIRAGDVISRIEDEDARGMSIDDAVKRLRGPKGTPVQHHDRAPGLRRAARVHGDPRRDPAALGALLLHGRRRRWATSACRTSTRRRPAVPARATDCERELEQALRELKRAGATSVILDIRDNPGGLLDQAFAVSNLFLKKGQLVVFTRGPHAARRVELHHRDGEPLVGACRWWCSPRATARALARSWPARCRTTTAALIVGETTFGKGLVQTIMPLRNVRGYALALTTARYYTPSGRSIQRDYGSTALEEYYAPRDRKACDAGQRRRQADRRRPQGLRRRRHHPGLLRASRRRRRSSSRT